MQQNKMTGLFIMLAMLTAGHAFAEDTTPDSAHPAHDLKADTNQDGKISYDEFRASHEKRMESTFKRMDANGDGFIDEAEKQKMHEKMREMRTKRKQPAP
ncbi:MAG: hypothetical protein WC696_00805 [Candidatus Methylopumilus sp.]|jgi:hypothetical protein